MLIEGNPGSTVQSERHQWKREVAALSRGEGLRVIADELANPRPAVGSYFVIDLLRCAPLVGEKVARRFVVDAEVSLSRAYVYRVRDLTQGERDRLARTLLRRAER